MNKAAGEVILGIDPGRSKTGLALTDGAGQIKSLLVAPTAELAAALLRFTAGNDILQAVLGDGTNSAAAAAAVRQALPRARLTLVPEQHSTEEARVLYWQLNPPKGWRRLAPLGLLVPEEPLDAYAAVVLVRRYLQAL